MEVTTKSLRSGVLMNNLPNNEIAIINWDDASKIIPALLNNDYAVMVTLEEDLFIINYEWANNTDRNYMIFRNRGDYEYERMKEMEKENTENA